MPFVIIPVGWMVACLENDPNAPSRNIFPGIFILKFWQGIVDIVLRASTIVRELYCMHRHGMELLI